MESLASGSTLKFSEVRRDLTTQEAVEEANRCLYCYDAPCTKACPTGIPVPSFIKKIASGNLKGSARVILEANPMGATCSRVCPTEELCEGACVLNELSLPIMIGDLQRHATNWAMQADQPLFQKGSPNGMRVAVIGSGPAGLSAARELARFGYGVTVYEAKEKAGGLDTYGIVPFRLPQEIPLWEAEQVRKLGVDMITNTTIGEDIAAEEILSGYDAVVLATGMAGVPFLGIPGEDYNGVYDAIELIEDIKESRITDHFSGKRAVVIGAGNTAIDAAACLKRLGAADVKIIYRRTEMEMTAYKSEYAFAKQDGIEFRWLAQPKEIIGNLYGNVSKLICDRVELGDMDESGKRRITVVENAQFEIEADVIVRAIGQKRRRELIDAFGLAHERGVVKVDPNTYQTSNEKVYAAGDVIFGTGKTDAMVVSAAEQGKQTAYAIHRQLLHPLLKEV
ncbi:NAD(P)-dependent oxidoreductase [Heyndrickxia coagulans]|jgi:dihydropyrimidine dehydrogenase (NAD+) subunit PreT|uniref:NAD(P)-dependent oxidoreductase n=1 Tax=Heyndrickxia coagulans TaxID=1398 RepID=UPI0028FBA8B9|nr:NAD(P)-dependent oxidoreductase [Heyndrickxia coagulans]MDT9756998.1 NAD(P)-dependent oxidoreductase [Heyndrickxia coagulans]